MFYIYVTSKMLSKHINQKSKIDYKNLYDPSIAMAMYDATTQAMRLFGSKIAYFNMHDALIFSDLDKEKWPKDIAMSYAASIYSSGLTGSVESGPHQGGDCFLFKTHISYVDNFVDVIKMICNMENFAVKTFMNRLNNSVNESGYSTPKNDVLKELSDFDLASKFPHVSRRGITILSNGSASRKTFAFESLIDRKPSECFQQFFNQKAIEVAS